MTDKHDWLAEYVQTESDAAFRELVTCYVDLVYSTAFRSVGGDAHRAKDVTQTVFLNLARVARTLPRDVKLGGWLHRDTCFTASTLMRGERRRQAREKEAAEMNARQDSSEADYSLVAPVLDEAINELGDEDRTAILLRFFEQNDFRSIGAVLGSNEDAARMRVNRALEKLQELLKRRGLTSSATALSVVLSANAVQAAPVGLALTISTAAALTGTTLVATATVTATKAIAMTALQKTLVTATVAVLAGAGIYEARQASQLRGQVQTLQQQQMLLNGAVAMLRAENLNLSNLMTQAEDRRKRSQAESTELLKLRGQATTTARELAKLKTLAAQPQAGMLASYSNAWARGLTVSKYFQEQKALARIKRMKEQLRLTEDQFASVSNVTMKRIEADSRQLLNALSVDSVSSNREGSSLSETSEELEIEAILTSDQLAAYPGHKQSEIKIAAEDGANGQLANMSRYLNLSEEQKEEIRETLISYALNQSPFNDKAAIAQARATGNFLEILHLQMEMEERTLDDQVKILGDILTQEQLRGYKSNRTEALDRSFGPLKSFLRVAAKVPPN